MGALDWLLSDKRQSNTSEDSYNSGVNRLQMLGALMSDAGRLQRGQDPAYMAHYQDIQQKAAQSSFDNWYKRQMIDQMSKKYANGTPFLNGFDPQTGQPIIVQTPYGTKAVPQSMKGSQPIGDFNIDTSTDEGKKAFLESIPAQHRGLIQSMAEWKADPTKLSSMRGNERQTMFEAASKLNPDLDMFDYANKASFMKNWTSGKASQNRLAINTVLGHINTLDDLMTGLNSKNSQTVNAYVNKVKNEFGDPTITSAEAALNAVNGELANTFKQSGATDPEIASWTGKVSSRLTPDQWKGLRNTMLDLVSSRAGAYRGIFKEGMKRDMSANDVFDEKSRAIMDKFGVSPEDVVSGKLKSSGLIDPLEAEAQQAIANGADPVAVKARLAQLRSQNG